MMNVCMVLAGLDFPPDIRVEKEARALAASGHRVTVICNLLIEDRPLMGEWNGCLIRRLAEQRFWLQKKVKSLKRRVSFYDGFWDRQLTKILREESFDVLHVHDLPMLGTALLVGKRYKIPVVADLHENYPAGLGGYKLHNPRIHQRILSWFDKPSRWKAYELRCAAEADYLLVVVEEAKLRFIEAGIPEDKIAVIENTPDADYFLGLPLDEKLVAQYENEFVISYIGKFGGRHRGLDTAIQAMPAILKEISNARLVLVGKGGIKPVLEQMVAELSLNGKVMFVDWQPFEKIPSFVASSDVCLVPHHSNPNTEASSPHKLFQYMLMGKPVVVSSCKSLQRVVEETGSGLSFKAGDRQALASAVVKLKDEGVRRRLGEAGRRAVLKKYNWGRTSSKLVRIYEHLAQKTSF
jgi:glycosyltransferase involved in cell wall biosynthesis